MKTEIEQHINRICPVLSQLNLSRRSILIGDFNAHSSRWGYQDSNAAGKEVEDLLNSNPIDLIFNERDPCTYIHYNGTGSNPDLLCVATDLTSHTHREVIEDPGSTQTSACQNYDYWSEAKSKEP